MPKHNVWITPGQVTTKYLLFQTIPDVLPIMKARLAVKFDRTRKLVLFDSFYKI